ncbi:MAG: phosphatase PAP2 family protein [Candidatus Neomarinimicrobiota bacterium]|nr:phosphatase PAP2 family protein [Candidatus Neomarinimicrobiota bacterium]
MKSFGQLISEQPVNDKLDKLTHNIPLSKKRLKQMAKPSDLALMFDFDGWQGYPPPSNSSKVAFDEIQYLIGLQEFRDQWETDMRMHDTKVMKAFRNYVEKHNLEVDLDTIKEISDKADAIILSLKRFYNRPRPKVLANKLGLGFTFFPLKTAETPSYPSGHATHGRLVAKLIADEVPFQYRADILRLGDDIGEGRMVAGAHYPSDTEFGHRLGDELYRLQKESNSTLTLEELEESIEYDNSDMNLFAVKVADDIDNQIGSVNAEISKDDRSGKSNSKKIGVQAVLPANKRIAFTGYANDIIKSDEDLEQVKVASGRMQKDFAFRHKDMDKYVYVNTRPDGKRGGGAKADPNELMTAALCTLSSVPKVETIEDLDALIENVKKIASSGKVVGHRTVEVEALEKDYGNLCQAISAAEVIIKNGGGSANKTYLTGQAWDNDVKGFQMNRYGMKDFNSSDFIIRKGNNHIGISLKKKKSATSGDPTLINKSFRSLLNGSQFNKVKDELDTAAGEFYVKVVRVAQVFQRRKPKIAVDSDGNPWLNKTMLDKLGPRGAGINNKNWGDFVRNLPNDVVNYQLKKSKSLFKPMADVIINNADLFADQLIKLIIKADLKELQKVNFDFALVTGLGRYLPSQGPVIESGEYNSIDIMTTKVNDLLKTGKPSMKLDERKTQAFDRGATAAMLHINLNIGTTAICDITLRYKGNFSSAPSFLATFSNEFKQALK